MVPENVKQVIWHVRCAMCCLLCRATRQCGSLRYGYGTDNRGQNARRPLICRLYAALVSHNILFLLHITTCSSPSFYCHSFIYISFVLIKLVVLPPGEDAGLISCRRRWLLVSEVVPRKYNPCLDYSPPPPHNPYVLVSGLCNTNSTASKYCYA